MDKLADERMNELRDWLDNLQDYAVFAFFTISTGYSKF